MQPKSLLRLVAAASKLEDLTTGTFKPVLDDPVASQHREAVQRLVFCSGHVSLRATMAERPANVAVIRVEELSRRGRVRSVSSSISIRTSRGGVGAGRAEEHGRLDLCSTPPRARRLAR